MTGTADRVGRRAAHRAPSPLRRREFRLYFSGNLVSNSGTWLQNVTLAAYMLELTNSSFWVGLTAAALFAPVLLFALPAGALADRTDRLRLLQRSQMLAGVVAAAFTILVATGLANRYTVVAVAGAFGLFTAVAIPTMQSLIPSLVPPEQMAAAIGLNALTFNVARLVGPVFAAATLATLGPVWAFAINAASFFVLVAALAAIRRPPFPRGAGVPGRMREGVAYAWHHRKTRRLLLAVAAMSITLDPITTLSPALARSYGLEAGGAGWLVSAWGGGAVLGITVLGPLVRRIAGRGLGWIGLLGLAAGMLALGSAPSLPAGIAGGVLTGAGYIVATIAFLTAIHADVPDALRGRVLALWVTSFLGPRAFVAAADGALADAVGPHVATMLFAAPALVAAWLVRRTTPAPAQAVAPPA